MSDHSNPSQMDAVDQLTDEQQSQLTELLDQYLQVLERGERVDPAVMTTDHPELADLFACYVGKLNEIHGIAAEVGANDRLGTRGFGGDDGCRLGDFEIIQEIGRGGMGTVYEARQIGLGRHVALKLLPMTATFDARQVARFRNEANAAGQLNHPNIVPIYSVGAAQRIHYYSMQLIEGISIEQWIRDQRAVDHRDWRQTVRWIVQIASALQCAHESGVVHRDVKPSNLLLDRSSRIWITDFGLARCQTELALTQSGDMIGTLRYMSPEQAAGKSEIVDHRTDIHSLAATLFEMLALRPAVQGNDSATLLRRLAHDEPPKLSAARPDLPVDLSVVLQKGMAKHKDDRYDSAEQFATDLQAVLDGRPTLARPPSVATVVQRFAIRHRAAVIAGAGMLAVVCMLLTVGSLIVLRQNQNILDHKLRADRNFHRARATVDELGSTVAERLAAIPGTEQVRRALLEDTLDYYQQFVAESSTDLRLQTEIAETHTKIGCLIAELESPHESIEHFLAAGECFALLPESKRSDSRVQRLIAANGNYLGLALAAAGHSNQAAVAYRRSIDLQTQLVAARSGDPAAVISLATMQNNLGLLYQDIGRPDAARELFRDSIQRLKSLTLEDSSRSESIGMTRVRSLAAAMSNLSSLTLESDPTTSAKLLEAAVEQRLESVAKSPNRLEASSEIARMYNNLGSARMRLNDLDSSATAFDAAIRLQRRLNEIAPDVHSHRRELALSLNNLAMVRQKQSQPKGAVAALQEGVRIQRTLSADVQTNPDDLIRLGAMEHNLAVALMALHQDQLAVEMLQQAIERQRAVLSHSTDQHQSAMYLRQHLLALLKSQVRRGQWREMKATESALRESARDDQQVLNQIESDIRNTRVEQTRQQTRSVAMVNPW